MSRDDRGATAIIVALSAVALFGAAAFSMDAGNLWQTKRNMVTASDAAALAAAGDFGTGKNGCTDGTAGNFLTRNRSDALLDNCVPNGNSDRGYVTVKGHTTADFTFAGIFGIRSRTVASTTTALWGIPSGATGLRPFGLCLRGNNAFYSWLNLAGGGPTGSRQITIPYAKDQDAACGDAAGNWGLIDFNGGANSNSDTKNWVDNGYSGTVSVGDWVPGDPGAFSSSLPLADILHKTFALPVFDVCSKDKIVPSSPALQLTAARVAAKPTTTTSSTTTSTTTTTLPPTTTTTVPPSSNSCSNGNNANFHIVAFVIVTLDAFRVTGSQANRSLTLTFQQGVIEGTCCGDPSLDTGSRVVRICDVNTLSPDPNACTR